MKQLLLNYFFIILALSPVLTYSQQKNDNTITVRLGDSTNSYEGIVALLEKEGYKLFHQKKESGLIHTKDKTIGKYGNTLVNYIFNITGNTVTVTGRWFVDHWRQGKIANDKWAGFLPGWKEMDRLAKLLGTTTYSKTD